MTVGPVSSATKPAATPLTPETTAQQATPASAPAAAGILRSGEKQASTQDALKDPNAKTYYHRVKGAKFIMPNGLELQFLGGLLVTNEPDIIRELDAVANKSTSMIYTVKAGIQAVEAAENKLAEDASKTDGVDGKQG